MLRYQHDSRKNKLHAYFYLGSRLVAIRETPIGASNHVVKYQHTDALGSPVAVTDSNRVPLERTEYEPYGKVLNRPTHDGPGFTGHIEDAATGLTYMQQRYFDPLAGRFLSVDPVAADPSSGWNFNRFNYAANNPYKYRDPDGRVIDTVFDVGFAAYSAYTLATQPSWTNAGALAADLAGIAIPGVTGLGAGLRAAAHAGDAARSSRSANELGLPGKGAAAGKSVQLSKGLASQQQLGELASGLGTVTHGVAAHKPLRAAENLASQHGGQAADYQKVSSSSYDAADGSHVETHAFRNSTTGQIIEPKTVINP
ncbi:RHS repeat-associated core domain-containing protein [Lysobacter sp. 2RAF19]